MEERRLNNILLHLSPSSRMLAGKSAICDILNGKRRSGAGADSLGDRWNLPITVLDDLPLPHRCKEDLRHQYESRDRMRARQHEGSQDQTVRGEHLLSSSSIGETAEGRFEKTAGQIEEDNSTYASYATLRGHVTSNSISCAPQLPEDLLSFGELTLKRCTGTEISRTTTGSFQYQIGREVGASAGRPMLHGDNGNASRKAALKFETEQEEGSERSKLVVESRAPDRERELKSNVGVTDLHVRITEKSFGDYTVEDNKDAKGLQGKGGRYKADNNERAEVTRSFFKSLFKQEAIHSMPSLTYSQALECKNQAPESMKVSRNNAMTGQRRITAEDCIFCLIVQGRSPAFKLYEDEMCICILDVHPLSHGHSLIIPKAHFPSLEFTPPEIAAAMCAAVPLLSIAIMEATDCESFNLLVNSGKAAGQVVFHTHFHIIPRRLGDGLWRSEDAGRRPLSLGHETSLFVQQIRHKLSGDQV